MSQLNENRIDVVLTPANMTAAKQAVNTILAILPVNAALTDEQRLEYGAIDVDNKVFAYDVLTEALLTGTGIIPAYINLTFLKNDLTTFDQLGELEAGLANVLQRISDAKRIAGHEAMKLANPIYKAYKDASEVGIDNARSAYERLQSRYGGRNGGRLQATDL